MNTIHFEGYKYIHLDNKFHQSMLFLHIVYMDHYHKYLKEVVDLVVVLGMVEATAVMEVMVVLEQEKIHNILSNNEYHHLYHNFFLHQSNYNHTVLPEEPVDLEDLEDLVDLVDLVKEMNHYLTELF